MSLACNQTHLLHREHRFLPSELCCHVSAAFAVCPPGILPPAPSPSCPPGEQNMNAGQLDTEQLDTEQLDTEQSDIIKTFFRLI